MSLRRVLSGVAVAVVAAVVSSVLLVLAVQKSVWFTCARVLPWWRASDAASHDDAVGMAVAVMVSGWLGLRLVRFDIRIVRHALGIQSSDTVAVEGPMAMARLLDDGHLHVRALHEAAHAVMVHAVGMELRGLDVHRVRQSDGSEVGGTTTHRVPDSMAETEAMWSQLLVSLAPSQMPWLYVAQTPRDCSSDFVKAEHLARALFVAGQRPTGVNFDEWSTAGVLAAARSRAWLEMGRHREAVEALADELERRRSLGSQAALAIIDAHPAQEP